jgi:hypothetical protein
MIPPKPSVLMYAPKKSIICEYCGGFHFDFDILYKKDQCIGCGAYRK